ncbi:MULTISPECIES: helix-turn-helix domain-containing protein [Streptomyces]|uniref:Helix-turn-helix transcriptional regulator n=1 Tax=Streptomyces glycanivorans TaxID=3033808 RepID=A0ABY9JDP6_9ACTN|nr:MULTISPECIES: helix-turn-helix transcriptional regulator [unclassified Streptomyces]WSQ79333.1 helix-turn-helix domain-containing protein [Streptomyces sp. NBC_01213]TXS09419.1 XRE family transcriptional regulator [Streptomyces sp. wa22]WLQ65898.1 helix-turn-helix transcriptional regulator [Streptomyces sp. Alt3]WSQ86714.1 helix-turn-helix domain-containing protein [Streptomyces sp. NBC_01212]WSR07269.1 helix-turn-helix domain-containing protein [Streptomyces sp. NBC_01208]
MDGAVTVTGTAESPVDPGAGFLRSFGRQVKLLREAAGLTQAELGTSVGYGEAHIASVEQGRRIPKPEMVEAMDRAVGGRGVLVAMKGEVERARYPSFFRQYVRLEAEAAQLHAYDSHVVKGLLQTEEYARAVFEMWRPLLDADTVEQRVAARMERQRLFSRRPAPLLSFVIEETVLRRPLGGRIVLRAQLEQLLLHGHERNIEIQVMPTEREEHAGLAGAFTLLHIGDRRRMAYMEVQNESALHSDPKKVGAFESTYGVLRAQALTPRESLTFIKKLLGEQ